MTAIVAGATIGAILAVGIYLAATFFRRRYKLPDSIMVDGLPDTIVFGSQQPSWKVIILPAAISGAVGSVVGAITTFLILLLTKALS